jgi:hypothetical protein
MTRQAPRFCLADKYGKSVFVGDRIMWYSDSYLSGEGRVGRYISGEILEFRQYHKKYLWGPKKDTKELITKVTVKADPKSYGKYDYGQVVSLSNLNNIQSLMDL